jgi:DNA-binding HxlR family transcriptional regulator
MAVTSKLPGKAGGKNVLKPEEFCPIRQTVRLLGRKWTMLVIKEIYYSKSQRQSFMELRRRLSGASAKVLSERLKEMANEGIVRRRVRDGEKPVRVFYTLSAKGKDACRIIEDLKKYGLKWGMKGTFNCENVDCELCERKRMDARGGARMRPAVGTVFPQPV